MDREKRLDKVYCSLTDELSKKSMVAYISQLIDGEYYHSDGLVISPSYFDNSFLKFSSSEVFVDCGAYNGDDTENFFYRTPNDSKVVLFEADGDNCKLIEDRLIKYNDRFILVKKAVWNETGMLTFSSDGKTSSQIVDEGISISCTSIDEAIDEYKIIPTYIKMDIEGVEIKALIGARNTIKEHKPKLAICVYHRTDDLIEIWEYINTLREDYKFYLRKHGLGHHETVLYAV